MRVNSSSSNTRARHNSRPRASTSLSPRIRSLRFSRVNSWRPRAYKTQPGIPLFIPVSGVAPLSLPHFHCRVCGGALAREKKATKEKNKKKKKKTKEAFETVNPRHDRLTSSSDELNCRRIELVQRGDRPERSCTASKANVRERGNAATDRSNLSIAGDAEVGPNCKISCARDRRTD